MTDRIDALKTLMTRLIDSREGYRESLDHVESPHIREIFEGFLTRRDRNASEIRAYLTGEGHSVDADGSLLGAAHRVFVGLKDAVTAADDAATLAEVVRGENVLLDAYDEALTASGGADPEYMFLKEQHASLGQAIAQLETRRDLAA
ncbi:PA2169 family four-helix-bundle protein [uncultured Jannaschia sp.]|uniref:PA2169 family four-helix-bundle protein n=1 Tax=uncultured Jannaschia sp. TaxID=293347 RepID=UPI0026260722|nr:PA2169 family four-helix-bundle protein [uncultured Jannaschia sp.]